MRNKIFIFLDKFINLGLASILIIFTLTLLFLFIMYNFIPLKERIISLFH